MSPLYAQKKLIDLGYLTLPATKRSTGLAAAKCWPSISMRERAAMVRAIMELSK